MALPQTAPDDDGFIDLTEPPPLAEGAGRLNSALLDSGTVQTVAQLAREDRYLERVDRLCTLFRDLETSDSAAFLIAASKLAVRKERAGLRALFAAFDVKPPGVEVLRNLQALSCLERVSLRLAAGTWKAPEGESADEAAFPILDVLDEAGRVGILPPRAVSLPEEAGPIRTLCGHIRRFVSLLTEKLGNGERLPDPIIQFLVQLCMLELSLMEKRISHLAETIDPYDMRGMARLMPVLSRYDQDIEHMKSVVSRLTTYRPFFERTLTLENAITANEMDRVGKILRASAVGAAVADVLDAVRANPVLDRQLFFLVSSVHQIATLRSLNLPRAAMPDVMSTLRLVAGAFREGRPLRLGIEDPVVDLIWPVVDTWGILERDASGLLLHFRDERALDFVDEDGTPRLPEMPGVAKTPEISIEQLVRQQMNNDPFLAGVLENPKLTEGKRVVSIIATGSRSLRILVKIINTPRLHTGETNKDVPRLLLMNPARIPVSSLRKFIHVRYVSKTDLGKLASPQYDIRREIQHEIRTYLKSISK
jgi:hypothetical protein